MESAESQLRHHVIQDELREILDSKELDLPIKTDAVLVLSHAGLSSENTARTNFGVELVKKITARRLGLGDNIEITSEQISESGPYFIIDGISKRDPNQPETLCQNEDMRRIAIELGVPQDKIIEVDNGTSQEANTKTQFEKIPEQFKKSGLHLTLVSSDYHGSRVARTASAILPEGVDFTFIGMPWEEAWVNQQAIFKTVRGEVKRIIAYSKKGDITTYPRTQKRPR